MTATTPTASHFCSVIAAEAGEDPAGSAWASPRYLALELPLPWPYDLLGAKHVPAGLREIVYDAISANISLGFVGIAPDEEYSVPGMTRLIDLVVPADGAARYERREYLFPAEAVVPTLRALADDPASTAAAPYRLPGRATRDIVVCTHGAVDACCATFGYPAFKLLRQIAGSTGGAVRVWRSTHFGGHRFASTVLDLPDARYWGFLQSAELARLIHRDRPVADLIGRYRGWSALADPIAQIAEREPFAAASWAWTRLDVCATIRPDQTDPWLVDFAWTDPGTDRTGRYTVEVRQHGTVLTRHHSGDSFTDEPQYATRIVAREGDSLNDGTG